MHCKFLVFLLTAFFFFSFFSSACECRFIERIGAHGKQNPDFIYYYYYYYVVAAVLVINNTALPLLLHHPVRMSWHMSSLLPTGLTR